MKSGGARACQPWCVAIDRCRHAEQQPGRATMCSLLLANAVTALVLLSSPLLSASCCSSEWTAVTRERKASLTKSRHARVGGEGTSVSSALEHACPTCAHSRFHILVHHVMYVNDTTHSATCATDPLCPPLHGSPAATCLQDEVRPQAISNGDPTPASSRRQHARLSLIPSGRDNAVPRRSCVQPL